MRKSLLLEFVALGAIWGSSFLFMRLCGPEFGVVATAGGRVAIAAAALAPVLWFSGQWQALRDNAAALLMLGLLNSAFPFALFSYAVMSISTGLSAILNATAPLFGTIILWVWLKERPARTRIAGLVIGFAGVVALAADHASFKPGGSGWAIVACLLASVSYGFSASYTRRYLTGVHPLATATGSQISATMALIGPSIWLWPEHNPGPLAWLSMLALGLACTALAYLLYFRLIAGLGPSRTITVTFLIPVFAVAYGSGLLGEMLTPWMLLCGAVVVLGTALATGVLTLSRRR